MYPGGTGSRFRGDRSTCRPVCDFLIFDGSDVLMVDDMLVSVFVPQEVGPPLDSGCLRAAQLFHHPWTLTIRKHNQINVVVPQQSLVLAGMSLYSLVRLPPTGRIWTGKIQTGLWESESRVLSSSALNTNMNH